MPTPYTPFTRKDFLIGSVGLVAIAGLSTGAALWREHNIKVQETQNAGAAVSEQRVVTCAPSSATRSMTFIQNGRAVTLTCG